MTVGASRNALVEAVNARAPSFVLHVGTETTVVETPRARAFDALAVLAVVNVGAADVRVAGKSAPEPLRFADDLAGAPRLVVFVRADDDATMGRLFDVVEALRRAGAQHVVVGASPPSAVLGSWNACPWPLASDLAEVDSGEAIVAVLVDEDQRPAAVKVRASSGYGFGGAAALCIAHRSFPVGSPGADGKPFRVHFQRPPP